jgi:tetratricopeptide (TPR) repeat protein
MNPRPPHEPAQIQALSAVGVLDAAFQLYRAHFRALMAALVPLLGVIILVLLLFQSGSGGAIVWTQLSPLRPEALVDALDELRLGLNPIDTIWDACGDLILLVFTQVMLNGVLISTVARAYLAPYQTQIRERPRGLRGEVPILPGVLAALPLTLLGALIARSLTLVLRLLWVPDEFFDIGILRFIWDRYGPELLVMLLCAALVMRLLVAAQAAVLEPVSGLGSLGRSWRLTRGSFSRVAVVALMVVLLPALLLSALPLIAELIVEKTAASDLYVPLVLVTTLLGQVLLALAYAFQLTCFTLLYYDLRVRSEGLDLVLRAQLAAVTQARQLYASGAARLKLDDLAGALTDFELARLLLPGDWVTLSACVGVLLRLGEPARALDACEQALTQSPDDPHLLHCRGLVRFQLGDRVGGQADYDQARHRFPNQATALISRAHLKHTIGAYDSARDDLLELLRLKPGEAVAMYNIACGYARQHQPEAALDWLQQAIAQDKRYRAEATEDADFAELQADPRWVVLLAEVAEARSS